MEQEATAETKPTVWLVKLEYEEGSRNGEVCYVLGAYATEKSAETYCAAQRAGNCNSDTDEDAHCFCDDDHDHDKCESDCDLDGYWCHRCGEGYEVTEHEVQP